MDHMQWAMGVVNLVACALDYLDYLGILLGNLNYQVFFECHGGSKMRVVGLRKTP